MLRVFTDLQVINIHIFILFEETKKQSSEFEY